VRRERLRTDVPRRARGRRDSYGRSGGHMGRPARYAQVKTSQDTETLSAAVRPDSSSSTPSRDLASSPHLLVLRGHVPKRMTYEYCLSRLFQSFFGFLNLDTGTGILNPLRPSVTRSAHTLFHHDLRWLPVHIPFAIQSLFNFLTCLALPDTTCKS
jgi:hypothetical protein